MFKSVVDKILETWDNAWKPRKIRKCKEALYEMYPGCDTVVSKTFRTRVTARVKNDGTYKIGFHTRVKENGKHYWIYQNYLFEDNSLCADSKLIPERTGKYPDQFVR